jgi:hypothetical protein
MTDETTPATAATEADWIDEVDESGDKPKSTGRQTNRWTGETRETPANAAAGAESTTDPKSGEIRDAAGRHEGFAAGSAGDDSRGTAPDSSGQA